MAVIRHLERAPITEALVDFKVALPDAFPTENLGSVGDRLKSDYPIREEQSTLQAQFRFGGRDAVGSAPVTARALGLQGYFFRSADRLKVAQFRRDGFTFNRLAPYTRWEDIRAEAIRLWEVYREVANPERLERLGLRYINRLVVPPRGELATYLAVTPPMIPGLPTHLASFLMRLAAFDPESHYLGNVTLALEQDASDPSRSVILLDLEAYTGTGLGLSAAELLPILEVLHVMKNEIFFGCITEETARRHGG
jgi:uncharacterized protein (TIGR04255 family)